jgi:hypothetical protein
MVIEKVDKDTFSNTIALPFHEFNASEFSELNAKKVNQVHYLLFKDSKYRLGIILGEQDNILRSPFSAPFGGFCPVGSAISLAQMDEAIKALKVWSKRHQMQQIQITLPPLLYGESYLSKWVNTFYRSAFQLDRVDLNYAFQLSQFGEEYVQSIRRNARKSLRAAFKNEFRFSQCVAPEAQARAYEVIRKNRSAKGYPLRMSWEQVAATTNVIPADFFLLEHNDKDIAAALVYEVQFDVAQVIYWGELPAYSHLRPMNYLSYCLFEHYQKAGKRVLDIGPSTESSVPNHGLCEFKESIGCQVDLKLSFFMDLST